MADNFTLGKANGDSATGWARVNAKQDAVRVVGGHRAGGQFAGQGISRPTGMTDGAVAGATGFTEGAIAGSTGFSEKALTAAPPFSESTLPGATAMTEKALTANPQFSESALAGNTGFADKVDNSPSTSDTPRTPSDGFTLSPDSSGGTFTEH